jgi:hypothetical protein
MEDLASPAIKTQLKQYGIDSGPMSIWKKFMSREALKSQKG